MKKIVLLLIIMVSLAPPLSFADDNGFEGDGYVPGPGVFSGEKGVIDLGKLFTGKGSETHDAETGESQDYELEAAQQDIDYKAYQDYKAAKSGATQDYQEYVEFKKYQEWKKQQKDK